MLVLIGVPEECADGPDDAEDERPAHHQVVRLMQEANVGTFGGSMSEAHRAARRGGNNRFRWADRFFVSTAPRDQSVVTGRSSSRECARATTSQAKVVRPSDSGLGSTLALAGGHPAPGV
jgi:hypothetical protein